MKVLLSEFQVLLVISTSEHCFSTEVGSNLFLMILDS